MKSTGFKMNRYLKRLLTILQVDFQTLGISEAQAIHEIRAITTKYQPLEGIQGDLDEIVAEAQANIQAVEPVAANDNGDE